MPQKPTWAVGVITVSSRLRTLLPQTLNSLRDAGFPKPWLFIDCEEVYGSFAVHQTAGSTSRHPRFGCMNLANWTLGIWELYMRFPHTDYYAMFEDDVLACNNLRRYLEINPPSKNGEGYWNLFSFDSNLVDQPRGWNPALEPGLSATGLVFDRDCIVKLLGSRHFVGASRTHDRPKKALDAVVKRAMDSEGVVEYVHNPSLLYHAGVGQSTIGKGHNGLPQASTFPGEDFNALEFLR